MMRARIAMVWLAVIVTIGCGGSSPSPTPVVVQQPSIPACQANHTASASFKNAGSKVIDVVLDGGVLGTLAPGETGLARTIAAGVAHDIKFRITNTSINACAAFNPIPVECSTPVYSSCGGF